ncbi:hypothetical protein C8P66_117102 [Humitalea rosea]|uniref:Uncharacterized protein n=1 Tax=Humitalea rosea TaxID=990373 RepID=A0A2W7I859_9PROT|nr:hypothetical protein [Humitalea rosea]PZW43076.1 hypothetical protein C8P66_117102 [Humitalea rosea]
MTAEAHTADPGPDGLAMLALGLRTRLRAVMVEQALAGRVAPPPDPGGRPPSLLPAVFASAPVLRGAARIWRQPGASGGLEWRLYLRPEADAAAPFRYAGAIPHDLPAEAFVDAAFRLLLGRPADPETQAIDGARLTSFAAREALVARLAGSAEAARGQMLRLLVLAVMPPAAG